MLISDECFIDISIAVILLEYSHLLFTVGLPKYQKKNLKTPFRNGSVQNLFVWGDLVPANK